LAYTFQICPTNKLIIEWKADLPGARWCFYRVCDSPNDAKRSLAAINGESKEDTEQMDLFEKEVS
jgi:hypothetical protein